MPAIVLAWLLYAFNLFALGPVLVLFVINLMIMGWWVALGVVSLILRHGAGAEALAWSRAVRADPVLPPCSIPSPCCRRRCGRSPWRCRPSHVFEGMRAVLAQQRGALGPSGWAAFALNVALAGRARAAVRTPVPRGAACAARC